MAILTFGSFSWPASQDNEILCLSLPLANGQEQHITLSLEKQLPWLLIALQSAFFLHTETQLASWHNSTGLFSWISVPWCPGSGAACGSTAFGNRYLQRCWCTGGSTQASVGGISGRWTWPEGMEAVTEVWGQPGSCLHTQGDWAPLRVAGSAAVCTCHKHAPQ